MGICDIMYCIMLTVMFTLQCTNYNQTSLVFFMLAISRQNRLRINVIVKIEMRVYTALKI